MKRKEEPTPKAFVRLVHFEELRTIRRKQPGLYLTMSRDVKAQLELYCYWRNRDSKQKTAESRERKIRERGGICACCGESIRAALTFDHIIPRSKGGTSAPANLQLLCLNCNGLKADGESCQHQQIARELMFEHVA